MIGLERGLRTVNLPTQITLRYLSGFVENIEVCIYVNEDESNSN